MRVEQANLFNNASYRLRNSKKIINKLHDEKYIHIHDKEYSGVTYNCLGINFKIKEYSDLSKEEKLELALEELFEEIVFLTNEQSGGIGYINIDSDLTKVFEDISVEKGINSIRRLFRKLNLPLRNGYERAYVTFNLGLDTSKGGKKVTEIFLKALELGDFDTGEPFIFPNIVFKLKRGVNLEKEDKNFDLLKLALIVSGKRMNPTYFNCDSIYLSNIEGKKLGIMGCRTLLTKNIKGENGAINRGNIASISINLPKLAIESKNEEEFFIKLKNICEKSRDILLERYRELCKLDRENFKFIIDNQMYLGSENGEKSLKNIFSNGTLSIGFIGLFDCIAYLKENKITLKFIKENIELGEKILQFMRELTDKWSKENNLNFSLLASSGEGISGRFAEEDREKEFYTNSFHIPVYLEINPFEKLEIEARFLKYCNGGEISYIEFPTPILLNSEAIFDIIKYGVELNHIYMGINFPLDYCLECKTTGIFIKEYCNKCGSKNIKRLRRVSGYLSLKENLSKGKKVEEQKRIPHLNLGILKRVE